MKVVFCECPCGCDWEASVIMGGQHLCRSCFNSIDWDGDGLQGVDVYGYPTSKDTDSNDEG